MDDDFFDDFGWDEAFVIGGAIGFAEEECEAASEQRRLQEEQEREMERFSGGPGCDPFDPDEEDSIP